MFVKMARTSNHNLQNKSMIDKSLVEACNQLKEALSQVERLGVTVERMSSIHPDHKQILIGNSRHSQLRD